MVVVVVVCWVVVVVSTVQIIIQHIRIGYVVAESAIHTFFDLFEMMCVCFRFLRCL